MEKISICICTRNRKEDLKKAINSIYMSTYKNYEIIVSDDSTNDETKNMISKRFPGIVYLKGPKKGLSYNRNNALQKVTGSRILFMDDDVIMNPNFLKNSMECLYEFDLQKREKVIISGLELNRGILVYPNKFNFLGHQTRKYKKNEKLTTIVINSTIFPSLLLKEIKFDEQLIYGYDEVDIAVRAIYNGYNIYLCENAINNHYPSEINRNYYKPFKEASRIYVTFKRYYHLERKYIKSILYLLIAYFHLILHKINNLNSKRKQLMVFKTIKESYKYIKNYSAN